MSFLYSLWALIPPLFKLMESFAEWFIKIVRAYRIAKNLADFQKAEYDAKEKKDTSEIDQIFSGDKK